MYIIEGYPEFELDLEELFMSPISQALELSIPSEKIDNNRLMVISQANALPTKTLQNRDTFN